MNTLLRVAPGVLSIGLMPGLIALASAACSGRKPLDPVPVEDPRLPKGYQTRYYQGMRYGLFVPPSYDRSRSYPLIVQLHGSGDTTSWDLGWYHAPIQATDPVFVITPKSLQRNSGWGTSWDATFAPDIQATFEILAAIQHEFNIDPARLYVNGTSMGGFGVFNVLSKKPGMFAGAYSICGGGTPATAAQMMQTPLWIFHGSADPVVPVTYSRDIYRAILAAGGGQVRYTEYPGVGHAAWTPANAEKTLSRWLLAQRKGSTHAPPDSVTSFRVERLDSTRFRLTWAPPADTGSADRTPWFYRVYRDQTLIADVEEPSYTDAPPPAGTHLYAVATVSYYFRESIRSAPLQGSSPSGGAGARPGMPPR